MSEELPKGWVMTTLGDVCAINPRPLSDELPSEEIEVSFVPMAAVEQETGRMDTSHVRTLAVVSKSYTPFKENDVVFAKITPCMENGKIALASGLRNGLGYGSTEFFVLRPFPGVLPRFVLHFLLQPSFRNDAQASMTGAVGHQRVPAKYLFTHPFPLPPTREQERIMAKLDSMLARVAKGEAAARRALDRLQHYRAAVLHAAITGELTREWRKTHKSDETGAQLLKRLLHERRSRWEEAELKRLRGGSKSPNDVKWKNRYEEPTPPKIAGLPSLPREWTWTNLSQLKVYSIYGPRFGKEDYAKKGVAVVRTTDIDERGRVSLDGCPKLPLSNVEYEKYKVEKGDLLITRTGSIGTLAIFNDTVKAIPGAYLLHYRLVSPKLAELVYAFLCSPTGQKQLWEESSGSGRQNLSAPGLESISIPLPPLREQKEIIKLVERRQKAADRLSAKLNRQLERTNAARESLLREAFAGNLALQDPNDEPTSFLLERIQAARDAEANKPKPKRMPKTKLKIVRRPLLDVLREQKKPVSPEQLFREAGFQPGEADVFYRELASLRKQLREKKPAGAEARAWPQRSKVTLELKKD